MKEPRYRFYNKRRSDKVWWVDELGDNAGTMVSDTKREWYRS